MQRAMKNGKLSLSSVEGISDLINSETNEQRKQALRQVVGKTGTKDLFLLSNNVMNR
jgi:tRNA modification GTPase